MNELDRYAVSLENMEVLRAQVEAQAREIAVLKANVVTDNSMVLVNALAELERLKAKPSGMVPDWLTSSRAFADRLYEAGWRDHADAQHAGAAGMYEELIARLNQPASAGGVDERSAFEAWMVEVEGVRIKPRFDRATAGPFAGDYRDGQIHGWWNVWQARAALSANHSEQVRDALAELLECPASVVQATVPRAGIEAAPPYQVVLDVSVSLTRWKKARAALEAASPISRQSGARRMSMKLIIGNHYNWKHQHERLVYIGMCEPRNGHWHQFAKVESPEVVWCEVLPNDLHMLEETKPAAE